MVDPGVPLQCSSSGPAGTTWDHAGRTCPQVERGVPREAGQSPACPLCGFGHPCIPGPRPQFMPQKSSENPALSVTPNVQEGGC